MMNVLYEKHNIFPTSILIRKFIGRTCSSDIINSWEYLLKNNLIDSHIKGIITDLTVCDLNLDLESFEAVLYYMEKQDCLKKIKCPVISNNPKIIIFPFLAEKQSTELKVKPFSTIEAATNWILTNSK